MVVRTVSQLPLISRDELQSSAKKSYVEVSYNTSDQYGTATYLSKKATAYDFGSIAAQELSNNMVHDYDMNDSKGRISLSGEQKRIDDLYYSDIDIKGIKNFKNFPMITSNFPETFEEYGRNSDYVIPNVRKVKDLVSNSPAFISTTSSYVAEGNPFRNSNGAELSDASQLRFQYTIDKGSYYMWKIPGGGTDSSKVNWSSTTFSRQEYEEMRDDGQLVLWGWLADSGMVSPECAWIGVYTKLKGEGNPHSMVDIPISIQPWIRGTNSSKLQYVGFTIPVKAGTKIFIKTGFAVNDNTGSYDTIGSMTFIDNFIPNCFFGYIIKN